MHSSLISDDGFAGQADDWTSDSGAFALACAEAGSFCRFQERRRGERKSKCNGKMESGDEDKDEGR